MRGFHSLKFIAAASAGALIAIIIMLVLPAAVLAQQHNLIVYTGSYNEAGGTYTNLFYSNPDGTGKTQITNFFPYMAKDPQVSSDGKHLAFCSNLNAHRSANYEDIFRFDLTAAKLTRVTGDEYVNYSGTGRLYFKITDDISTFFIGKNIALDESSILVSYQGCERFYTLQEAIDLGSFSNVPATRIWAKAVAGRWIGGSTIVEVPRGGTAGASIKLTDGNFSAFQPSWSPDGTRLAGVSGYSYYDPEAYDIFGNVKENRTPNVGFDSIAVWARDGSLLQLLEADANAIINSHPKFSPDGTRLAYSKVSSLVVVNAVDIKGSETVIGRGGTDYTTLKNFSYGDPDWSPDGARIACVYVTSSMTQNLTANIVLMDPGGSGEMTQITNVDSNQAAGDPDFSPDGQWIAYTLATSKGSTLNVTDLMTNNYFADIYIQNVATGEKVQVTNDGVSGQPCWALLSAKPAITPDMGDDGGNGGNGTQCPFSTNMADERDVMILRAVRDLLQTKDESLVDRYYQHAFEVSAILRNSPQLKQEFQDLTLSNLGIAQELAAGGHAMIDRQSLQRIVAFLEKLQGKAGRSLRQSLRKIAGDMQEEGFLRSLGIEIAE